MRQQLIRTIAAALPVGCSAVMVNSIHEDAALGYLESIHCHLSLGTDIDSRDEKGRTPLMVAFINDKKPVVNLLFKKDVDVNAFYKEDKTPLDFALQKKKSDIAELLRKRGGKMGEELKQP
ncbi:MAG: ankyrin repeat domain-containing protein [Proteobacteria bacterium]|jgi:ankyrin repeat protein|nr:ankyrin repeat domain-containing protein [Pseudomonadota bacterium]